MSFNFQYRLSSLRGGIFIGLGLLFSLTTSNIVLSSFLFSFGFLFVVNTNSHLFTGQLMNYYLNEIGDIDIILIYIYNFLGCLLLCTIIYWGLPSYIIDAINQKTMMKISTPEWILFTKGVGCNFLVCLGVYINRLRMATYNKTILISLCIALFVALGFEHSIADMSLFIFTAISDFHLIGKMFGVLVLVTCGNIIGAILATILTIDNNY